MHFILLRHLLVSGHESLLFLLCISAPAGTDAPPPPAVPWLEPRLLLWPEAGGPTPMTPPSRRRAFTPRPQAGGPRGRRPVPATSRAKSATLVICMCSW